MEPTENKLDELARIIATHVKIDDIHLPQEYFYKSLPLAVIDAVFSIGVTYTSTANTVRRFCENQTPSWARYRTDPGPEYTIKDFLNVTSGKPADELAAHVYGNRQRTSATNGILKAEAVTRWAEILLAHGVSRFADVPIFSGNPAFEKQVRALPGQGSGISLDYFKMLTGDDSGIKPDRHILRFMEIIGVRDVAVLKNVAAVMKVTPRLLDYVIWQKMSKRAA